MAKRTSRSSSKSRSKSKSRARGGDGEGAIARLVARIRELVAAVSARIEAAFAGGWPETIGWGTVLVGVSAAWWFGVPRLEARVQADRWSDAVTVSLDDPPAWLDADRLARIERDAAMPFDGDPFDRTALVEAGAIVAASGWFESVDQVRRTGPDTVVVEARPRVPFALVRSGRRDHLVDRRGRRMPFEISIDEARAGGTPLVVVSGVRAGSPAPGEAWPGVDLQAGLSLLAVLADRPWSDQVATIEVGRHASEGTIAFTTFTGSVFEWASPPGAERPYEPTAAAKLAILDRAAASTPSGRIDGGAASRWVFYDEGLSEVTGG